MHARKHTCRLSPTHKVRCKSRNKVKNLQDASVCQSSRLYKFTYRIQGYVHCVEYNSCWPVSCIEVDSQPLQKHLQSFTTRLPFKDTIKPAQTSFLILSVSWEPDGVHVIWMIDIQISRFTAKHQENNKNQNVLLLCVAITIASGGVNNQKASLIICIILGLDSRIWYNAWGASAHKVRILYFRYWNLHIALQFLSTVLMHRQWRIVCLCMDSQVCFTFLLFACHAVAPLRLKTLTCVVRKP